MASKTIRLKGETFARLQEYGYGFETPDEIVTKLMDGTAVQSRKCANCDKRFRPVNNNQRYCPNTLQNKRSKCAQVAWFRMDRQRQIDGR